MTSRLPRPLLGGLALLAVVSGSVASLARLGAQEGAVLHEFVPDLASVSELRHDATPSAVMSDGHLVEAPAGGARRPDERAMSSDPGNGGEREEVGRRSPTFSPDRITSLAGAVPYFEVFTPSVSPYKRVTSLDTVTLDESGQPILGVSSAHRSPVRVLDDANAPSLDGRPRDRFWGSVVLDFGAGREVPLPTPGAEPRFLLVRSEPDVSITIEVDGAGNYFAVLGDAGGLDEAHASSGESAGEVRLIYLVDVPRSYFGLEAGTPLPNDPVHTTIALPPAVAADATRFAQELGLARGESFDRIVSTLAAHFRSFEESDEPPTDTGNIYLDLARGRRGVCRHRAYAFTITALALGVPTRFVQNEAHAWVEVQAPGMLGWLRIDLGGSARGLRERNANTGPRYQPRVADPFPRPEAYRRAMAEAAENNATAAGATSRRTTTMHDPSRPPSPRASAPHTPTHHDGAREHVRSAVELTIDQSSFRVFRGETLEITGTAHTPEGDAAAGLRVEGLLRYAGRDGEIANVLVGTTLTDEHGLFHAYFGVPPELAVGRYELVVVTPGDARFMSTVADIAQ